MKRILTFVLTMTAVSLSGNAMAEPTQEELNAKLNGEFAYSRFRSCVQNRDGFGENLENLSTSHVRSSSLKGTWTFNGDGTGKLDFVTSRIRGDRLNVGQTAFATFSGSCDATYQVNADRTFSVELSCSAETLKDQGNNIGGISTRTGIKSTGFIKKRNKVLIFSDVEANVEPGTFTRTDGSVFTSNRICQRSGIAFKK